MRYSPLAILAVVAACDTDGPTYVDPDASTDAPDIDATIDAPDVDAMPEPDGNVSPTAWVLRSGAAGDDVGMAAVGDAAGNVVAVGHFAGSVTLGGATLTSVGETDVWVAKFASDGSHQWSVRIGGTTTDKGFDVAVDAAGDVYVAGEFTGTVDFGAGNVTSVGGRDAFLLKLSGADGSFHWVRTIGGTSTDAGWRVLATASTVYFAGRFTGTVDLGEGNVTSTSGDYFVLAVSPANTFIWAKPLTTTGVGDGLAGIAVVGTDVVAAGYYVGTATLGGESLAASGEDFFLVRYDGATGDHVWSRRYGNTGTERVRGIAACGTSVYLTGHFFAPANLGDSNLSTLGSSDAFVASYSAADGAYLWAQPIGGAGQDDAGRVTCDVNKIVAAIHFRESVTIDRQQYQAGGNTDTLLIKMTPSNGGISTVARFGGAGFDEIYGLHSAGAMTIGAGKFESTASLFGNLIMSAGGDDAVVFSEAF